MAGFLPSVVLQDFPLEVFKHSCQNKNASPQRTSGNCGDLQDDQRYHQCLLERLQLIFDMDVWRNRESLTTYD